MKLKFQVYHQMKKIELIYCQKKLILILKSFIKVTLEKSN